MIEKRGSKGKKLKRKKEEAIEGRWRDAEKKVGKAKREKSG